jgi:polar amino acid transport system substrate-binding protein
MKKFLMLAVVTMMIAPLLRAEELVVTADPWCPYVCEPESDKPGFMVEIARTIFGKAGHTIHYKNEPWARVIKNTTNGKINGAFGAFKSDAPGHIFAKEELGVSTILFYVEKGTSWKYSGPASLANVTLGVIRGYSYGDEVDAYVQKYRKNSKRVQVSNTLDSLVKKLMVGRIDAFPDDRMVVEWYLEQKNLSGKLQEAGLAVEAKELYIAFSPKLQSSKEYADILSKGIETIRKNGELSRILSRYGLKDWK